VALWTVDRRTGEIIGWLPNGRGGGRREQELRRQLQEIEKVISLYSTLTLLPVVSPLGAFSLGAVAAYGRTLVRLYGVWRWWWSTWTRRNSTR
jgi:hypothetical protein